MPFRGCKVSYEERGRRQTAEVDAESAYEAVILALKYFRSQRYIGGPRCDATLELEIDAPQRLKLKLSDVVTWLYVTPGRTPAEKERKKRLQGLLADDRH